MNKIIRLLKLLLKDENVKDYLVVLLAISYIVFVGYGVIVKGKDLPMEFVVLVSGALGTYFHKKKNG